MGLKGDIEEIKADWSAASWRVRGYYLLSGLIAISSVASLSEYIVKWKGFIHDGLVFYREWITLPLRTLLALSSIHLTEASTNLVITLGIFIGSFFRACFIIYDPSLEKKEEACGIVIFSVLAIILTVHGLNMNNITSGSSMDDYNILGLALLSSLELSLFGGPELSKIVRWVYVQIFFIILCVGLLAAINKGLHS